MYTRTILEKCFANVKSVWSRANKRAGLKAFLKTGSALLSYTVVLLPGSFFCALGAVTFIYPQHASEMFALALLFAGVVLSVVGYRLIQLRLKCESILRKFNGKIYLQGIRVESGAAQPSDSDEETESSNSLGSMRASADRSSSSSAGDQTLVKVGAANKSSLDDNVIAEFAELSGSKKVTVH